MIYINEVFPIHEGYFPFEMPDWQPQIDYNNAVVIALSLLGVILFPFIYALGYNLRGHVKLFDWTCFGLGITLILLEIYKQITYAKIFGYMGTLDYYWKILPLQLCSIHMFILPLIPFLKGRTKQSSLIFCAVYGFIGGIAILGFKAGLKQVLWGFQMEDGTCFGDWGMLVHTLLRHGILINMGAFIFGYLRLGDFKFTRLIELAVESWTVCVFWACVAQGFNIFIPLFLGVNNPWVANMNLWNFTIMYSHGFPVIGPLFNIKPLWLFGSIGTAIYVVCLLLANIVVQSGLWLFIRIMHRFQGVAIYTRDTNL